MGFTGVYTASTQGDSTTGLPYADFLLGQMNNWNAQVTPEYGGRMRLPQLFVQDDYKLTPNLTVNLGLRYQIQSGWGEVKGNMATFDPTVQNPASGTLGAMWFGNTKANGRYDSSITRIHHCSASRRLCMADASRRHTARWIRALCLQLEPGYLCSWYGTSFWLER